MPRRRILVDVVPGGVIPKPKVIGDGLGVN
jgi:hypothetical protein